MLSQAGLKKETKIDGRVHDFFSKSLLGHEVFSFMASWAANVFCKNCRNLPAPASTYLMYIPLDFSNNRPIYLLSNIEKILEKRMYKKLYTFLNNNNVIYKLQFRILYMSCLN